MDLEIVYLYMEYITFLVGVSYLSSTYKPIIYIVTIIVLYFFFYNRRNCISMSSVQKILYILMAVIVLVAIRVSEAVIKAFSISPPYIISKVVIPFTGVLFPFILAWIMVRRDANKHKEKQMEYIRSVSEQIDRVIGRSDHIPTRFRTGDKMLDSIVVIKSPVMSRLGVEYRSDGMLSTGLNMDKNDIIAIFGNAFDNAIEAVARIDVDGLGEVVLEDAVEGSIPVAPRKIYLELGSNKKKHTIKLSNTTSEYVDVEKIYGNGSYTSKENESLHGSGLAHMLKTVKKYGGGIVALSVALLIIFRDVLTLETVLLCAALIIFGCRLSGYLLYREMKHKAYRAILHDPSLEKKKPIGVIISVWIFCALLYVGQISPVAFRLASMREGLPVTTTWAWIGLVLIVLGTCLEAGADLQKNAAKKKNAHRFVDTGLYSIVRCPNYLGEIIFWTVYFFLSH